jgi:hypothetical protein
MANTSIIYYRQIKAISTFLTLSNFSPWVHKFSIFSFFSITCFTYPLFFITWSTYLLFFNHFSNFFTPFNHLPNSPLTWSFSIAFFNVFTLFNPIPKLSPFFEYLPMVLPLSTTCLICSLSFPIK